MVHRSIALVTVILLGLGACSDETANPEESEQRATTTGEFVDLPGSDGAVTLVVGEVTYTAETETCVIDAAATQMSASGGSGDEQFLVELGEGTLGQVALHIGDDGDGTPSWIGTPELDTTTAAALDDLFTMTETATGNSVDASIEIRCGV